MSIQTGFEETPSMGYELACSFSEVFADKFVDAELRGAASFEIYKNAFDGYLVLNSCSPYQEVPDFNTPEWDGFTRFRGSARTAMNKAARVGAHGHPPYRMIPKYIDQGEYGDGKVLTGKNGKAVRKGSKEETLRGQKRPRKADSEVWVVQLADGIARFAHTEVASQLSRWLENKQTDFAPMLSYLEENQGQLNPTIQLGMAHAQRSFKSFVSNTCNAADAYVADIEDLYTMAVKLLGNAPVALPKLSSSEEQGDD